MHALQTFRNTCEIQPNQTSLISSSSASSHPEMLHVRLLLSASSAASGGPFTKLLVLKHMGIRTGSFIIWAIAICWGSFLVSQLPNGDEDSLCFGKPSSETTLKFSRHMPRPLAKFWSCSAYASSPTLITRIDSPTFDAAAMAAEVSSKEQFLGTPADKMKQVWYVRVSYTLAIASVMSGAKDRDAPIADEFPTQNLAKFWYRSTISCQFLHGPFAWNEKMLRSHVLRSPKP